jgi:ketosteroid isomerase-like protein
MFGRSAVPGTAVTAHEINTMAAVDRFNAAFDRQDLDAVMAAMTSDCVFESTSPPDGEQHAGQAAVRTPWATFFADSPDAVFETEDSFACGDRTPVRWLFRWDSGHVRGVDVFRVRDGLVAEKLSCVKG